MTLKIKLGKAEYDALEDAFKGLYIESGDGYKLDADYEDVSGLKRKNQELLDEINKKKDIVKQFEGLDAEAARQALAQISKIEEEKLLSKQKFDEVLERRQKEWQEKLEAAEQRSKALFDTQAERDMLFALTGSGIRKDAVEDAAIILRAKYVKPVEENGKPVWKSMDETETYSDLKEFINGLKGSKADWFEPTMQAGGGAPGSGNGTGDNKGDSSLTPVAKLENIFSSGK